MRRDRQSVGRLVYLAFHYCSTVYLSPCRDALEPSALLGCEKRERTFDHGGGGGGDILLLLGQRESIAGGGTLNGGCCRASDTMLSLLPSLSGLKM